MKKPVSPIWAPPILLNDGPVAAFGNAAQRCDLEGRLLCATCDDAVTI